MYFWRWITIIFFIFTLFLSSANLTLAVGKTKLGRRCRESHECGVNMGCRESDRGDFSICKITVPGTEGCDVSTLENICADGLVCIENRCKSNYGLEDVKEGNFKVELEKRGDDTSWHFPEFITVREHLTISNEKKVLNTLYALLFLIGLTMGLKGFYMHRTAVGFVIQERTGKFFFSAGAGMILVSILLWKLFN